MNEEPLWPAIAHMPRTYRLLHLPTFERPTMIRLTELKNGLQVIGKRTDGQGGYSPGILVDMTERQLTSKEAKQFDLLFNSIGFCEMASFEPVFGLDGERCIFEGADGGRYHVVDRWSLSRGPYPRLVEFLLSLAVGLGDSPAKPLKFCASFAELAKRSPPKSTKADEE